MDFSVSEPVRIMLDMVNEFVDRELVPLEPEFLSRPFKSLLPVLEEKRRMVKQMELWGPIHPKAYGGMGLGLMDAALLYEAMGRTPLGLYVFGCQAPDAGNAEILHLYGTQEQKETFLRPLVEGKIRSCFSMTEIEMPGSNPLMMETTAVKDGGDYVINGHKWYTTAADGAAFAIVMAVTNPEASPYRRASMIIVPTDIPGFDLVRNISIMGHAGSDWESHGEIIYRGCRVPVKNLLGPEGEGFVIAQQRLGPGRIHHCMRWIGICHRAFDMMCARAVNRPIEPGKTLASKQIIQQWIAECAAEIHAARMMVLHAAWMIETLGVKEARKEISYIKYTVPDVMGRVVDRALQVHGGLGMTDDTLLAFYFRTERAARIYDGADEVHKTAVARRVLKDYAKKFGLGDIVL